MRSFYIRLKSSIERRICSLSFVSGFLGRSLVWTAYDLNPFEKDLLKKADLRVSRLDDMYLGPVYRGAAYFYSAITILRHIRRIISTLESPKEILDFPSGYGRLGRFWPTLYPQANVTASDIHSEAIDYYTKTFGGTPFRSKESFDEIVFPKTYDVIFCGSLITHLSEERIQAIIRLFHRSLNPLGVVILRPIGMKSVIDIVKNAEACRSKLKRKWQRTTNEMVFLLMIRISVDMEPL